MSAEPTPAGGCLQSLLALVVFGALALAGVEVWEDRYAWPVAEAWYRLDEADGRVSFRCQNFAPVEFAASPAPGVKRVLLMGGSSTFGFPERPVGDTPLGKPVHGFAGALQAALDGGWPGVFEVVDLGVNGGNSEDTLRILRRATGWGAAGIVVYDGHNEMMNVPRELSPALWRFALYRRISVMAEKADVSPGWVGPAAYGGPENARAVREGFRRHLDAIVDAADGVPVVLASQAANLAGFDPSWSVDGDAAALAGLARATDAEVDALYAAQPTVADVAWAAGQRRLARGEDAAAALRAAADHDGMPFRASTEVNAVIREVAADRGVVLADAEAAVGAAPGDDLFYDWVHPRPEASARIAGALLDGMGRAGLLPPGSPGEARVPAATPAEDAEAAVRTAASWVQWACVRGHDPGWRLAGARRWAGRALALVPGHADAVAVDEIARALAGEAVSFTSDAERRARLARIHRCVAERLGG
ncbi:MAG: hypothetical protein ACOZNI_14625 [Myxococcota bacterium]